MTRGSSYLETPSSWLNFVSVARRARGFDSAIYQNHDKTDEQEMLLRLSLGYERHQRPLSARSGRCESVSEAIYYPALVLDD